jgi:hypothetical protein
MDNEKKDYNLRAMFITHCPVRPKPLEIPSTGLTQHSAELLAAQDVGVTVVELQPFQFGWRHSRNSANAESPKLARSDYAGLDTHCVKWPVVARGNLEKPEKFWPSAGFAFPFVCSSLVDILHLQHHDILVADDFQFSGYVAWRLREITGVPYVIICSRSDVLAIQAAKPAHNKLLAAIGRDAELVLGTSTDPAITKTHDPAMRLAFIENRDFSGEKLKELLQEAVRQSSESFDW